MKAGAFVDGGAAAEAVEEKENFKVRTGGATLLDGMRVTVRARRRLSKDNIEDEGVFYAWGEEEEEEKKENFKKK